jgi:hypothetical protein
MGAAREALWGYFRGRCDNSIVGMITICIIIDTPDVKSIGILQNVKILLF